MQILISWLGTTTTDSRALISPVLIRLQNRITDFGDISNWPASISIANISRLEQSRTLRRWRSLLTPGVACSDAFRGLGSKPLVPWFFDPLVDVIDVWLPSEPWLFVEIFRGHGRDWIHCVWEPFARVDGGLHLGKPWLQISRVTSCVGVTDGIEILGSEMRERRSPVGIVGWLYIVHSNEHESIPCFKRCISRQIPFRGSLLSQDIFELLVRSVTVAQTHLLAWLSSHACAGSDLQAIWGGVLWVGTQGGASTEARRADSQLATLSCSFSNQVAGLSCINNVCNYHAGLCKHLNQAQLFDSIPTLSTSCYGPKYIST